MRQFLDVSLHAAKATKYSTHYLLRHKFRIIEFVPPIGGSCTKDVQNEINPVHFPWLRAPIV